MEVLKKSASKWLTPCWRPHGDANDKDLTREKVSELKATFGYTKKGHGMYGDIVGIIIGITIWLFNIAMENHHF